jgi:hypothetical protein
MRRFSALSTILVSLFITASPAQGSSRIQAAAVYSRSAGGYWILARVVLVGCEKSATISASGKSYVIAIQKSPSPVCPQIAHEADFTLFVESSANPRTVEIDTGTGTAFPYSVGSSDPENLRSTSP